MEYAIRRRDRVSQLLLMNTGPASAGDWRRLRESFAERRPAEDRAAAARVADAVPGARLSVLPRCGHFTYLEAPELVFAEIVRACGG